MHTRELATAVAALWLAACGADLAGLALPEDEPPPAVVDMRVVVGRTDGPGGDAEFLQEVASAVAANAAAAPASRIRIYDIGCPPALVLSETIGELPARPRARARHVEREGARLTDRITSSLASTPARRRGRCVAETITVAASADAVPTADEVHLVVVSSLIEQSPFARLDRGHLPTLRTLTRRAYVQRLLAPPGLLAGVIVHIAGRGIPGRISLARSERVLVLWRGLLDHAGASEVLVTSGPPAFDNDSPTEGEDDEREE